MTVILLSRAHKHNIIESDNNKVFEKDTHQGKCLMFVY